MCGVDVPGCEAFAVEPQAHGLPVGAEDEGWVRLAAVAVERLDEFGRQVEKFGMPKVVAREVQVELVSVTGD